MGEATQEHVKAAQDALTAGLASLESTDGWRRFLDARASLGPLSAARLSVRNQLSLLWQAAGRGIDSSLVATFPAWKDRGRFPRKGERALWVLQPRPIKRTEKAETGEDVERMALYFRPLAVFALAQTDGTPLPVADECSGAVTAERWDALVAFARTLVARVDIRDETSDGVTSPHGWYDRHASEIVVRTGERSRADAFATLAHECAHAILHRNADHEITRGIRETEAESVAYIVARASGLDADAGSMCYLASWNGTDPAAARKQVLACAERIAATASRILDAIVPQLEEMAEAA